jgi:hypothetical protein
MSTVWDEIEAECLKVYSMPHNLLALRDQHRTPAEAAREIAGQVQSGLGGSAERTEFVGPRRFLRVVGPSNAAYSGQWWFDADLLHRLDTAYSRIFFKSKEKKAAIRDMLRELLAITSEWNAMTEVWALDLPPGERLVGYVGRGAPQQLFGNQPLTAAGNRMLVGQAEQVFFPPTHNPLWITKFYGLQD